MLGLNLDYPLLLSTVIEHAAATFGDTEIVSHCRTELVRGNYDTAAKRSRRLASSLRRLGLEEGGVRWVARLEHTPTFRVVLWRQRHWRRLGILPIHACLRSRFSIRSISPVIGRCFIDADTVTLAEQLAPRLESVDRFVVMAARDDMPATALPNVQCYEDLIEAGDATPAWPTLDERAACALCFTSGTTGRAEGRALLASRHRSVGTVHRRRQRLGVVGQ